jgi:hypothetical protein
LNPVIKAQVSAYAKSASIESASIEDKFEIYSMFSTLVGFLGESVDGNDAHLKGSEFGLDGVAILLQGEIVKNPDDVIDKIGTIKNPSVDFKFFQSKTSSSFEYGNISKFFDAVEGFFSGAMKGESVALDDLMLATEKIYELGVGKKNPSIECFYISTGNYDAPARIEGLKRSFHATLSDKNIFDGDGIRIKFVGAKELQSWYRAATTAVEASIQFPKAIVMPDNEHVEEAYIGYISAAELLNLCTIKDESGNVVSINKSVFFDNIRDYDAKSKINSAIKESIKESDGSEFVFRNNGITVVSKNIDRTADRFDLEDFQIVNGCQTSNILFDVVFGDVDDEFDSEGLKNSIFVPMRLIGSRDDEFISSIIVGTNRQNPVKEEQFWALRPFLKSLEEYSRNVELEEVIFLERRENQYRGQSVERVRIIQPSALMKALAAAILYQPHRAARDYRGIVSEFESKLFHDDHDVRIYHAVSYLHYRLEFLFRNQKIDSSFKTFRYYILCAVGLQVSGGKNIFAMKKNEVPNVASKVIQIAKSEDDFRELIERSAKYIDARLTAYGAVTQEKIRDTIRSESFSNDFKDFILNEGK